MRERGIDDLPASSTSEVDAVVVGAGLNGLVAALTLAEAGWRVLVVEASARAGGALRTEELTLPDFRHDVGATVHALALASPALAAVRDEISFAQPPLPLAHAIAPGRSALLFRDPAETAAALGPDAGRWRALVGRAAARPERLAATVLAPTALPPRSATTLVGFGARGAWPAEWVSRAWFRTDAGAALFAGLAAHSMVDLREPLSAGIGVFLGALAHGVGWPVIAGGSERLVDALTRRLRALGTRFEFGTRVTSLADLPPATATILDLDVRQFRRLVGDRLPARAASRLARWRRGPGVWKVDWALDGPVPWVDERLAGAGTVHLGGTAAEIVRAERAVLGGRTPAEPFTLLVQATVADPSRAPAGRHTLWGYCHVPPGAEADQTSAIEARIERFAPGFRDRILARHSMGPAQLEAFDANLAGGDIGGGRNDWRQLLARPFASPTPWATPVPGLWLCSASTSPGGGAHGMGGLHAARAVLARAGLSSGRPAQW